MEINGQTVSGIGRYEEMGLSPQLMRAIEKMVLGVLTELFEKAERKQDLQTANTKEAAQTESWKDEQEELLVKTLKKYGGNRKKTAQELGISKSTLWRWMKKYSLFDENII